MKFLLKTILLLVSASSCSNDRSSDPAYIEASAEYKLAKQKSDLDGIFISLTKLESMDELSIEQREEFTNLSTAMDLLEKVRRNNADHDHESVVLNAAQFLKLYPRNSEVRKLFTESGNIFNALEKAQSSLVTAFPNGEIIHKIDENGTKEPDLVKMSNLIIDASIHVERAISLDPNFVTTQKMKKDLEGTKRITCILLAQRLYELSEVSVAGADQSARFAFNAIISIKNKYPSAFDLQETWSGYEPIVMKLKDDLEAQLAKLDETENIIRDLSTGSNVYKAVKNLRAETLEILDLLLDPRSGGLTDWSRNIDLAEKRWKKVNNELLDAMPNMDRIGEDVDSFASMWQGLKIYNNPETANLLK